MPEIKYQQWVHGAGPSSRVSLYYAYIVEFRLGYNRHLMNYSSMPIKMDKPEPNDAGNFTGGDEGERGEAGTMGVLHCTLRKDIGLDSHGYILQIVLSP